MSAVAALITLPVWQALAVGITHAFIHPRPVRLTGTPLDRGLPFEAVQFPSADLTNFLKLSGWLILPEGAPRGMVILCHGIVSNRKELLPQAEFLRQAGFASLLFDFRCAGESSGDTCTLGWKETEDVLGAVAYLKSRSDTRDLPLGAFGISMGGAAVLQAAARCPEIQAVGAECTYAAFPRAIDQRFRAFLGPAHPVFSAPVRFWGERFLGLQADTVSPLEAVRALGDRPLLLIHGARDITIRPEDSELLHAAASGPKDYWAVPDARHARCHRAAPDEYARRVTAFFDILAS